jgi:hypothetical protein
MIKKIIRDLYWLFCSFFISCENKDKTPQIQLDEYRELVDLEKEKENEKEKEKETENEKEKENEKENEKSEWKLM